MFSLVVAVVSLLLFSRVACGPTGVPGAGGPGRCVCRWAAARPRAVRAASLRLGASARSPARPRHRPRAPQPGPPAPSTPVGPGVLTCGLARRIEARPGSVAAHRHLSLALRSLRRPSHRRRCVAGVWLGASPRSSASPCRRPRVPQFGPLLPVGVTGCSRVEFLGCSRACCYKRRQSEGFFAENGGFWA